MSQIKECLVCKKTATEIPVTKFHYQESHFYICPQHIPILIHNKKTRLLASFFVNGFLFFEFGG